MGLEEHSHHLLTLSSSTHTVLYASPKKCLGAFEASSQQQRQQGLHSASA